MNSISSHRAPFARRVACLGVTCLALSLAACGSTATENDAGSTSAPASTDSSAMSSDTSAEGTLSVSASFYPIQYLVEAVGGDHVTVTSVTPTNVEPHDFELAPKDIADLGEADLITYVAGFQPSLDDAVSQVSGPEVLDLTDTVKLEHHEGIEDEHDHDGEGEADEDEGEAHEEHDHDGNDPHFWLDPTRMSDAAVAIEAALAQADPEHKADYEKNLEEVKASLEDLNSSYENGLKECQRDTFVTSHAAFGYMAERYGLTQVSISGVDPESEPSPADLAAVKTVVQDTGTTTIFTEELVSPETAEAVAAETGATTEVLSPIESMPEAGDYVAAMDENLDHLRTALECK